jgi:hypothetical protein
MPPDRQVGPRESRLPGGRYAVLSSPAITPDVLVPILALRPSALPERIARRITVHPASGCWIVSGTPTRSGHARIDGRSAARVVWEHLVGPVAPGLELDHREDWGCVSKACAYPGHVLPVTHFVNMTREGARGVAAINIRKDRCGACGTPYDLLNCYVYKNRRDCRRCIARRAREYQRRQRGPAPALAWAA